MAKDKSIIISQRTKDETGNLYGSLTVLGYAGKDSRRRAIWLCRCQCSKEITVAGGHLRSGHTTSCGCMRHHKHGACNTSEYQSWKMMKARCYNPNATHYCRYGGRGITVCDQWRESFSNFIEDMGAKPGPSYSLDRIDNNGNYEPKNCKWSTKQEQRTNNSQNRLLTLNGETMGAKAWADKIGISRRALTNRLESGWSIEKALTTPFVPANRRGVIMLTHDGKTLSLQEWARCLNIKPSTIFYRIKKLGWSVEKAITTPTQHINNP